MNRKYTITSLAVCLLAGVLACGSNKSGKKVANEAGTAPAEQAAVPAFNADSAYLYVKAQADYGPRVPNTQAHRDCGDYLAGKLEQFGAQVHNQYAELIAFDNTLLKARNIIGSYNPGNKRRILLCAHWDSRPFADQEPAGKRQRVPITGANDGASGVGVLLEIARQIQRQAPELGIDIVFFDAEDYGIPSFHTGAYKSDTWCLGAQYWGRMPHADNYNARFGILLDMVGGKNATFYYEGFSQRTAGKYVRKIWDAAHRLGYGTFFPKQNGSEVTDDHVYVYNLRRIPCVDIINYDPESGSGFGDFWHTQGDTMEVIDKATLHAVGQTVLQVIYNEK